MPEPSFIIGNLHDALHYSIRYSPFFMGAVLASDLSFTFPGSLTSYAIAFEEVLIPWWDKWDSQCLCGV